MSKYIIHLTDCHLFAEAQGRMYGVPTRETFRTVLMTLKAKCSHADLMVLTGDLAHDESPEAYRQLKTFLEEVKPPFFIVPGNHDSRDVIRTLFPKAVARASIDEVCFGVEVGGWLIIGLDTHVEGKFHGHLSQKQLNWLSDSLMNAPNKRALLFFHHPPVNIGTEWLDGMRLDNPEELAQVMGQHTTVKGIFCGHVHQEFKGDLGGVPIYCSPSTAMQFTPGQKDPHYDHIPPGFRVIKLDEKTYSTEVIREKELRFPPGKPFPLNSF